jgi:hypothetical protein
MTALAKYSYPTVRREAALALPKIGPGASEAVPALITALAKDTDADVRIDAASALGQIGPGASEAVPTLSAALAKDTDKFVRYSAVLALGQIGPSASEAAPALITALAKDTEADVAKDGDTDPRNAAAVALTQIAEAALDSKRTDMIKQLVWWAQALEASSFPAEAAKVRTAVDVLRAIQVPWYEVLYEKAGRHPGLVGLGAAYLLVALLWLALLWKHPQVLWRINEILEHIPKVRLPGSLGGAEISVGNLCLVGFFHYHPRVLDAWVSRRIATAQDSPGGATFPVYGQPRHCR